MVDEVKKFIEDTIVSDKEHKTLTKLTDAALGESAVKAGQRASGVDASIKLDDFKTRAANLDKFEKMIADAEKKGLGSVENSKEKLADLRENLKNDVTAHYERAADKLGHHNEALTEMTAKKTDILSAIDEHHKDQMEIVQNKLNADLSNADAVNREIDTLNRNRKAAVNHVESHFKDAAKEHHDAIAALKKEAGKLEKLTEKHAGVKASEHLGDIAVAGGKSAEKAAEKGLMNSIKTTWKNSGTGMKIGRGAVTALGVAGTFAGLKTIVSTPEPQEGQEAPSFASRLVKGGALAAVSLGAMYVALTKGGKAATVAR